MPEVVRLRNNHGHLVEVDHVPGPNPEHGDVIDVAGQLVTDEDTYRSLMGLPTDPAAAGYSALPPDVAGYHWILGADGQLRGWPAEKWDLLDEPADSVVPGGPVLDDEPAAAARPARRGGK